MDDRSVDVWINFHVDDRDHLIGRFHRSLESAKKCQPDKVTCRRKITFVEGEFDD